MKTVIKNPIYFILIFSIISFLSCEKEDPVNTLIVSPTEIEFTQEGGSSSLTINTNAESWSINNAASDWLVLSNTSGKQNTAIVSMTVSTKTLEPRIDTLTITAGNAKPVQIIVSQSAADYFYTLSSSLTNLSIKNLGGTTSFTISSNAPEWNLSADSDWLQISPLTGADGDATIEVTTTENLDVDVRLAIITVSAEHAQTIQITVSQTGKFYPNYNTSPVAPDITGMSSTADQLAAKINLGWNLGNSLEASGDETSWGNPYTTKALIDSVKQNGFNAVRLPCAWNQYLANTTTAEIKASWLNRVKEVIQYCVDNDMYVLLNIHWDGGWLENNCTPAKQDANNAKQKAFWEQIATHLRDFDEHLMFASANEPNVDDATQMAVLNSYHQTFIDAVRSTGGKNTYRNLVIQGPSTDIVKTSKLMLTLPTDITPNRMMVEVHYYTPWNFCGMEKDESWGSMFYYWGNGYHSLTDLSRNATYGEEAELAGYFKSMKTQFVDKGIPVVLGEYGAIRRSSLTGDNLTEHLASRAFYLKYATQQAKANGMIPFYWDNGGIGNFGFGLFNRNTKTVFDQQALDALIEGAK